MSAKMYPENRDGKTLIFRWFYVDKRTGKIIRAKHRPFPMWI